jgi:GNAT superfamily N-acetyltransferase
MRLRRKTLPRDEADALVSAVDNIAIEWLSAATDEVRALVGELDRTLAAEYPPEQRHGLAFDAIFAPNIRFFAAYLNGLAMGFGGVALFADFAEVKRMYVREVARGRGVGKPWSRGSRKRRAGPALSC